MTVILFKQSLLAFIIQSQMRHSIPPETMWVLNSFQVNDFYRQVLESFIKNLQREYRYKAVITDQVLYQMEYLIKQKLQKPQRFMKKCLLLREGKTRNGYQLFRNEVLQERQQRLKIKKEEAQYSQIKFFDRQTSKKHEKKKKVNKEIDDLQLFNRVGGQQFKNFVEPSQPEIQVKIQEIPQQYIIPTIVASPNSMENESQSESMSEQDEYQVQQCMENLNGIILANYKSNKIKHRPKDGKISFALENVFLKTLSSELFFGKIQVQFRKIEKNDLYREIYPKMEEY